MTDHSRALTPADIVDHRAYEAERAEFRASTIELKKRRRVKIGPVVSLVFENRQTIRFQIQEMARVERIMTDDGIQTELDAYNPLIPEPGHLSATLFLELTSEEMLREWLPKLVGIETAVVVKVGLGSDQREVRCTVDPSHAAQLTREDTTASVHYIAWAFTADDVAAFAAGPVALAVDHPAYQESITMSDTTRAELLADLLPDESAEVPS